MPKAPAAKNQGVFQSQTKACKKLALYVQVLGKCKLCHHFEKGEPHDVNNLRVPFHATYFLKCKLLTHI